MLFNRKIPDELRLKLIKAFDDKMVSLVDMWKEDESSQKLKMSIDSEQSVNQLFVAKCNQIEDNNHNLLTDTSILPYSVSAGSIKRLKAEKGFEAYINEEIIYVFKMFLQEIEIQKSPDDPHVYLPSSYEDILHPPVSVYPSTAFDKVIDTKWMQSDKNREQFYKEYNSWFLSKSKGRLDIIFDYFKAKGKVS